MLKYLTIAACAGLAILGAAATADAKDPAPALEASLVDAEKKAATGAATVQVTVKAIALVDPDGTSGPKLGQGHLHYQLDGGPIVATTSTKLSWHGLSKGDHKIVVSLADNVHAPLGPQQTLVVKIPGMTHTKH